MRKMFSFVVAGVLGLGLVTGVASACTFCYADGSGGIHCVSYPGPCPLFP